MASVFLPILSKKSIGQLPRYVETASEVLKIINRGAVSLSNTYRYLSTGPTQSLHTIKQGYTASQHHHRENSITSPTKRSIYHDVVTVERLQHAVRCDENKELRLQWDDGYVYEYPYVWLRDSCPCSSCYHPGVKARKLLFDDLDVDIVPSSIHVAGDGKTVTVIWPDGHHSEYEAGFLRSVEFEHPKPATKAKLWGSELTHNLPTFDFNNLMNKSESLLQFLEDLRDIGLTLVKNTPTEFGQVFKLAERVSHIRVTNYGSDFIVSSKHDPSNLAYTGEKLGLHVDLPFYKYSPGIQCLHCIQQCETEGGDSLFADGFKAAMTLKDEHPDMYETLASTDIDYFDIGYDLYKFHLRHSQKVLTFDRFGELSAIYFNQAVRNCRLRMPKENLHRWYKAAKTLYNIMHRQENLVNFKLNPGDIAIFNNTRTLHGRSQFQVTAQGERILQGCYLDWDCVHSRIRVLREELGMPITY